jgi:hypothetical protein
MDNSGAMGLIEGISDLNAEAESLVEWKRTLLQSSR